MRSLTRIILSCASCSTTLLLGGCVGLSNEVKIQPSSDLQKNQVGQFPGPIYYTKALKESDRIVLEKAYDGMMKVINNTKFQSRLNSKTWRAGCFSNIRVSGNTIISDLKKNTVSVALKKKYSRNANATTNIIKRTMKIDPNRFDNWYVSHQKKAAMINTLIHETTHLVPYDKETPSGKSWYYKYYDEGHNSRGCDDSDLVSYVVGKFAEETWIEMHEGD